MRAKKSYYSQYFALVFGANFENSSLQSGAEAQECPGALDDTDWLNPKRSWSLGFPDWLLSYLTLSFPVPLTLVQGQPRCLHAQSRAAVQWPTMAISQLMMVDPIDN